MKHTDRKVLATGIKYLAGALPLALIGPTLLFSAFNNQEHPLYIAILILGILASLGAILLMFKGIMTIVNSMFN